MCGGHGLYLSYHRMSSNRSFWNNIAVIQMASMMDCAAFDSAVVSEHHNTVITGYLGIRGTRRLDMWKMKMKWGRTDQPVNQMALRHAPLQF